jgi:hypothetical protein
MTQKVAKAYPGMLWPKLDDLGRLCAIADEKNETGLLRCVVPDNAKAIWSSNRSVCGPLAKRCRASISFGRQGTGMISISWVSPSPPASLYFAP